VRRSSLRAAGVGLAALATAAPGAKAASLDVGACGGGASANNNSWSLLSDESGLLEGVNCGSSTGSGSLLAHDKLTTPGGVSSGSIVVWRFSAPPGTTVTHLDGVFTVRKFLSDRYTPFVQTPQAVLLTCVIVAGDRCSAASPVGGWSVSATSIELGVRCDAVAGGTCDIGPTFHLAETTASAIRVTLDDPSAPTIATPVSGGLWSDVPVGTSGAVTFGATDNTGIAQARMYVDGRMVTAGSQPCDYSFAVPCANHPAMTLSTAGWRRARTRCG